MFLPIVAIPVASVYPFQILNQSLKQSNVSVSKEIERSSWEQKWGGRYSYIEEVGQTA